MKNLTFQEFEKKYTTVFIDMMRYPPDQAGSWHYAEKMAELSDAHPAWAEIVEGKPAV